MLQSNLKNFWILLILACFVALAFAGDLASNQQKWYEKYKKQENAPDPAKMLLNTEPEPELTEGYVSLFNGNDLTGWSKKGGKSTFEAKDGVIVGTCQPNSPTTYLITDKSDYKDFIFTCDMKWEVDGNSGVNFRSKLQDDNETVYGPQAEMEDFARKRFWSGGIYGQDCGGWYYPLWLNEHAKVREAMKEGEWNRLTIYAKGIIVKTWVNGIPAANWINDEYPEGFFGLQSHVGKQGKVLWRDLKVKELKN